MRSSGMFRVEVLLASAACFSFWSPEEPPARISESVGEVAVGCSRFAVLEVLGTPGDTSLVPDFEDSRLFNFVACVPCAVLKMGVFFRGIFAWKKGGGVG